LLVPSDGNCGLDLGGFVHIDLNAGIILDLVDVGPSFTEDPSDGTSGDSELCRMIVLLLEIKSLEREPLTCLMFRR
jgi:hypothetical protein